MASRVNSHESREHLNNQMPNVVNDMQSQMISLIKDLLPLQRHNDLFSLPTLLR